MNKKEKRQGPSILQQILLLPQAIQKRFVKQIGASFLIVILTIILLVYFKEWGYCFGFIIALYIAFLGFNIVWNYQSGKIVCKPMICVKAITVPGVERIYVIMKETEPEEGNQKVIHEYYIPVSAKDKKIFTTNTVINICYNTNSPLEVLAWEVIDYVGK